MEKIIEKLGLSPHPTGMGWYREDYRSVSKVERASGEGTAHNRSAMTSIYFLHNGAKLGEWRQLKSDEMFVWIKGDPVKIIMLEKVGDSSKVSEVIVGDITEGEGMQFQFTVPAHTFFTTEVVKGSHGYSLTSCVVAPGWELCDFLIVGEKDLVAKFPEQEDVISKFY